MSAELRARIRKNRELKVPIGALVFLARRPTDVEALEVIRGGGDFYTVAHRFVCGWEAVTENDVVGGGGTDPVKFDPDTWAEWCADRPDFWQPIATAVMAAYELHANAREALPKN